MKNLALRLSLITALYLISVVSLILLKSFIHPVFMLHIFILISPLVAYMGFSSWMIIDLYSEMTHQKEMYEISNRYVEKLEEANSRRSKKIDELIDILSQAS